MLCFLGTEEVQNKLPTFYLTSFLCMQHMASQNGGSSLKSLLLTDQRAIGAQVTVTFFIFKASFISDLFINVHHCAAPIKMILGFLSWSGKEKSP